MNDQPRFRRSLAEHDGTSERGPAPEFESPLDPPTSQERRRFLQVTGASMALASASAGTRTDQLPESYRRYLVNGMRKELGFGAVPVRLNLRSTRNPYDK